MVATTQIAGRYRVEDELARGGMGVVYRAVDTSTGKRVALKRLLSTAANKQHGIKLFQREYHTLRELQHPRIIQVYDYGVDAEGAYYTMELLDGQDLRELAPLGWRDACRHLRDVASSLALLHARRLIHRDLSARNVRLTADGRAKLLDFGALTTFGVPKQVVGTPPLVPPEALNGQALDQRADLYALGTLMYWLLTGRHAYPAQSLQALPGVWQHGSPVPPSKIVSDVPPELDHLVMDLVHLEVMSRPNTAAEVIERLNVVAGLESEGAVDVGHSYLSHPAVVGRDRELDRLHRFAERVVGGHAASLAIEGEEGIGKTRLLEELGVEIQLKGAVVLRVDAEIQRGPYAAVRAFAAALLGALPDVAVSRAEPHLAVLASVVPDLSRRMEAAGKEAPKGDPNEQRALLQAALGDWILSVASERPLLLALDNAQAADEASLALLVALPRLGPSRAVGIVATIRTGEDALAPRTLDALREGATVVKLAGLTPADTIALVRALFGDVDRAGRLGQWLRDRSDGNPMRCLALASQLIFDGHISYKDGAWILPAELSRDQIPSGMNQVLERRLALLGRGARALAEAVSIERGAFSIEECMALMATEDDELFGWIDELVQKEILAGSGDDYRFAQAALKKFLQEQLPEDRRRELHRRAAEFLLARDSEVMTRLDAGWHLLSAGERSRGADLLASIGGGMIHTIEGLSMAAPGLEVALEVFEQEGRPKWVILNVLEILTLAGWYVDRRYAIRYAERTLELAMELSGLSLGQKILSMVGPKLAVPIGALAGGTRHALVRRGISVPRFRKYEGVFAPIASALAVVVGVAANSFDAEMARHHLNAARILKAFPSDHILRALYEYAKYYTLATEGRLSEAERVGLRVLEYFQSGRAEKFVDPAAAKALSGGQMTGLATYTAFAGDSVALDWAEKLENLELAFYRVMAIRVRFIYHAARGELHKAAQYREQLELNAIQGGTTWQISVLIPLVLGGTYSVTGEVARLRQCADELELLTREIPSVSLPARLLRGSYHVWRGRPAEAIPLLREAVAEMPPLTHVLWAFGRGLYARALLAVGDAQEALRIAREGAEHLQGQARQQSLIFVDLELARCLAEAQTGNVDFAAAQLDQLISEFEPGGMPLCLVMMHETRARVAQLAGNADKFWAKLERMAYWARNTENPALVAKCKRLQTEGQRQFEELGVPSSRGAAGFFTSQISAIRTILDRHDEADRARAALRLIIDSTNARRGYLYLGSPPNLELVAQFPEDGPPSQALTDNLIELAAAVHQPTSFNDVTNSLTGTANVTDLKSEYNPFEGDDVSAHLLVLPDGGRPRVVGAVALKLPSGEGLPYEMLEAIARSLSERRIEA